MNCDLYRHFNKAGELLYVGISLSAVGRLAQHRQGSIWYDEISRITVEKFPSVQAAAAAEIRAIKNEKPKHNKAHASSFRRTPDTIDLTNVPRWSIRRWMICWMPKHWPGDGPNERGTGKLIQWPDSAGESHSSNWPLVSGACDFKIHKWGDVERGAFILSTAAGIIMNKDMEPEAVHALLWPILEYRMFLPPDIKAPPGDKRFGKYAADTEPEDAAA